MAEELTFEQYVLRWSKFGDRSLGYLFSDKVYIVIMPHGFEWMDFGPNYVNAWLMHIPGSSGMKEIEKCRDEILVILNRHGIECEYTLKHERYGPGIHITRKR